MMGSDRNYSGRHDGAGTNGGQKDESTEKRIVRKKSKSLLSSIVRDYSLSQFGLSILGGFCAYFSRDIYDKYSQMVPKDWSQIQTLYSEFSGS